MVVLYKLLLSLVALVASAALSLPIAGIAFLLLSFEVVHFSVFYWVSVIILTGYFVRRIVLKDEKFITLKKNTKKSKEVSRVEAFIFGLMIVPSYIAASLSQLGRESDPNASSNKLLVFIVSYILLACLPVLLLRLTRNSTRKHKK